MGSILLKDIMCGESRSDILIEGDRISRIRPAGAAHEDTEAASCTEVMDCRGKVAVPGFVNMHTHAAMSLMRGVEEDIPLDKWLEKIWATESKIDSDFIYWGTKAACIEMIRTGTTTFNDQYWFCPAARKAAIETGIRPVVSYVALDHFDKEETKRQKEQCIRMFEESKSWGEGGIFAVAFHAIYSTSEELMLWTSEFAGKHNLKLHIHLAETEKEDIECKAAHGGLSPVEYLDRLGILGPDVIAAHTLWLSPHDIEILGKRHVNCVHNVNSNTKLASGYRFRYNELRDAGANVCIGTDGCASSNNLDMLEAMKTSALVQKAWRGDAKALPLNELIQLATSNGAKALGIETGLLKEGELADILIVDTESTFFLSPGNFLSNFIYSAHSDCIDSVIAGGKFVMKGRKVKDEVQTIEGARAQLVKIK